MASWIEINKSFVVVFGVLMFFCGNVFPAASERVDGLPDIVVNVAVDNVTYRYLLHGGIYSESRNECASEGSNCAYIDVAHSFHAHQAFVESEAERNRNVLPQKSSWALFDADKKRVVYGFDIPLGSNGLSLAIAQVAEQRVVYSFSDPDVRVSCMRWLSDGKSLAILESSSRLGLTPLSLFGALTGHGMPVKRYVVRIVSFDSDDRASVQRFSVPNSFDDSVACLGMNG